jgi:1A family penicillin-binding protein
MSNNKPANHQSNQNQSSSRFEHGLKSILVGISKENPSEEESQTSSTNPDSFHARHPKIIKWLKILFFPIINPFVRYTLLALLIAGLIGLGYLIQQLPSPTKLSSDDNYAVSSQIFDRDGKLLYEIYADENRVPIKLEELPDHVSQATIAIEDKKFYKHFGLDVQGILRALRNNLQTESLEGGSTITQQLVKNALLSPEKTISRKAKEAVLAILTEIIYPKDKILEMYLNYISYGGTSVGIEAAAQRYFDKPAKDLTLPEAALLAGLPQAPSRYSPFGSNPEIAKKRQAQVLRRMVEDGYISQKEADQAQKENLDYALSQSEIKAPHFVFYVRDLLYEKYGVEKVETGGLRIQTSLDLDIQQAAQASVSAEVKRLAERNYQVGNGAAVITKPNTGEILAMVGSKDYFNQEDDGQVNVTLASRQPGSSIKPLMYATTFQEKSLNPGTILLDIPTCFGIPNQPTYCPRNYDGTFKGMVTVRQSLGNSLNIPAVKALSTVGVETFMKQATKMGITTWNDPQNYGLSLTLGGGEVKMIDMAEAYGTLANQGVNVPLAPILKIEDYKDEILFELDPEQRKKDLDYLNNYENNGSKGELKRVMERAPAYLVSHIMQDNQARQMAFGSRSELVIPDQVVSAKTGTTNDLKDNWTLGFTPEYLVISWVGNNDNTSMSRLASGVTGAAPIFNDLMSFILQGKEATWQEKPSDVVSGQVCASGMPPKYSDNQCQPLNQELYWKDSKPSNSKFVTKKTWIDPETGQPPEPGKHVEGLELKKKTIIEDPVTGSYCKDCSTTTDEEGNTTYHRQTVEIKDGKLKRVE